MMAGIDRYYQIVRCFRDEDLRADRQPEFTQLDIETSFLSEHEFKPSMEDMMRGLFSQLLRVTLPSAFPRMTYQEAMSRFGSDKPDLRTLWNGRMSAINASSGYQNFRRSRE